MDLSNTSTAKDHSVYTVYGCDSDHTGGNVTGEEVHVFIYCAEEEEEEIDFSWLPKLFDFWRGENFLSLLSKVGETKKFFRLLKENLGHLAKKARSPPATGNYVGQNVLCALNNPRWG